MLSVTKIQWLPDFVKIFVGSDYEEEKQKKQRDKE